MSEDKIRYHVLVQDAVRGVIRGVLQRVQRRGLPGDHHFYILFDTQAPGVGLSKRLKDYYPSEMTIVLQHQYQDLNVLDDRFEVRLYFNNIPERLVVPFSAIKSFIDPSVPYGLHLGPAAIVAQQARLPTEKPSAPSPAAEATDQESAAAPAGDGSAGPEGEPQEKTPKEKTPKEKTSQEKTPETPVAALAPPRPAGAGQDGGAKVVDLDRFRKK